MGYFREGVEEEIERRKALSRAGAKYSQYIYLLGALPVLSILIWINQIWLNGEKAKPYVTFASAVFLILYLVLSLASCSYTYETERKIASK